MIILFEAKIEEEHPALALTFSRQYPIMVFV